MRFISLVFLLLLSYMSLAQNELNPEKYKEFGLNMTGLIANVIPFNSSKLGAQQFAFYYKSTRIRKRSGKLSTLRFALGLNGFFDGDEIISYSLIIGKEKKIVLNEKWTFITGNDFIMHLEQIDEPKFGGIPRIGVGYGRPFGIEYHLNEHMSIFTETSFQITLGFPPVEVRIVPPVAIFFNMKI